MIHLNEYQGIVDSIVPGETRRVNHDKCTAGADSKRRLYITRPMATPEKLIGYCHNCQDSGVYSTVKYESYRKHPSATSVVETVVVTDDVDPPNGLLNDPSMWTTDAYAWFIYSNLTFGEVKAYGIALDPSTGRVYLPRYGILTEKSRGALNGYQLRKVTKDKGPKYLTARIENDPGYTILCGKLSSPQNLVVLVEDLVSGIHIVEAVPTAAVVVNYGVKVNLLALDACTMYANIKVWLDNDSSHVKRQADTMARTLQMLTNHTVSIVKGYSDPKHHTHEQIEEILLG